MAATSCNGLCTRHPKRTKKRIQAVNFDITKDAVCRKCETYFKNIEGSRCPCCHVKFSRRLTTMKTVKKRMHAVNQKLVYTFKYFWEMITKLYRKRTHKKKNMSHRKCLLCNTTKTHIPKHGTPVWLHYLHGFICLKCHIRNTRRNKSFARCPLGTILLSQKIK
jgi:hypothetical protein